MRAITTVAGIGAVILLSACHQRTDDDHLSHMAAGDVAPEYVQPGGGQGTAGLPASTVTAPARLAASPRHSEWVKIPSEPGSRDSIMAWVVYPSTSRPQTPVVVVVHEIFGLSTWVRGVADQVAAEGFIAIAPDFLSRVRGGPSSVELSADTARRMISGVNSAERNRVIAAAAMYATSLPSAAPRYGVIGYCWGGETVFMHAINGGTRGFAGGVAYYGLPYMAGRAPNPDSLAKITKPVVLLAGALDARIASAMPAIDSVMKASGKNYSAKLYDGAIHGFLRAQDDPRAMRANETDAAVTAERQANLMASKDAWPRTIAFLKQQLGLQ
jgi:carboxymethylenebutenolidase